MKKLIFYFLMIFAANISFAQNGLFNYKALITENNNALANHGITFRFTILENGSTAVYKESQNTTTDANGIAVVNIGEGTVLLGDFSTIDWGSNSYFLQVEINTGSGYQDFGTTEFNYVPYAKYADQAGGVQNGAIKLDDLSDARSDANGSSVFIGVNAGVNDDQSNNRNVGVGLYALYSNTTGDYNVAYGKSAMYANTSGSENAAFGMNALHNNTSGDMNVALGSEALRQNTTGAGNVVGGAYAMYYNTTGMNNVAGGFVAMYNNTTGYSNVALGTGALYSNTNHSNLVAIGDSALYNNGLNITSSSMSVKNTAVGSKALYSNVRGHDNTALGCEALYENTSANYNTANGSLSLYNNTYGDKNTAIGYKSLYANTTGGYNTAIGTEALSRNTTAGSNIAIGYAAMTYNTTGGSNVAIGAVTLRDNYDGEYNTAVGDGAFLSGNYNNSTALGHGAQPGGPNKVAIGNTSVTWIGGQVTWSTYSDERIKTGIKNDVKGLDFIMKLHPVTYYIDKDVQDSFIGIKDSSDFAEKYDIERIKFSGFLAQEVEQAAADSGYEFSGVDKPSGNSGLYSLSYAQFVVPLVKAVQEQQEMIEQQKQTIESLQQKIEELEKQNQSIINRLNALEGR